MMMDAIERYLERCALDESLNEHDEKYHPDGYKDGDTCNKREDMSKGDSSDNVPGSSCFRDKAMSVNIEAINRWGTTKSEDDAVAKFNKFKQRHNLGINLIKVVQKKATDGSDYYVLTAKVNGGYFDETARDIYRAFSQDGLRCTTSTNYTAGTKSITTSMPGKKLLKKDVRLSQKPIAADIRQKREEAPLDWKMTEKSEVDKSILQDLARESQTNRLVLNQKVDDFGGGKIPLWKALIRAHEMGWSVGQGRETDFLFDPDSNKFLKAADATQMAMALGIKNAGRVKFR